MEDLSNDGANEYPEYANSNQHERTTSRLMIVGGLIAGIVLAGVSYAAGYATRNDEVDTLKQKQELTSTDLGNNYRIAVEEGTINFNIITGKSMKYKPGTLTEIETTQDGKGSTIKILNPIVIIDPTTDKVFGYARACNTVVYPLPLLTDSSLTFTDQDGSTHTFDNQSANIMVEGLADSGPLSYVQAQPNSFTCTNPAGVPIGKLEL